MPIDPNDHLNWNVETLYKYIGALLDAHEKCDLERHSAQDKATDAAFESARAAIAKAEMATQHRFDSVNEFRAQLSDQTRTFITRQEYKPMHDALVDQVATLRSRLDMVDGRSSGLNASWIIIGQVLAIVIALASFMTQWVGR